MARVAQQRVQSRQRVPVEQWDITFLEDLQRNHGRYLRMDVAASTQKVYDVGVRRYMLFCDKLRQPRVPNAQVLSQFIIGCARANYALSTIRVGVAALQRWAADEYGVVNLGQDPWVVRAMKVAARLAVLTTQPKLPLSAAQLGALVRQLDAAQSFIGTRDGAMFQVGWAGMLRSSELVGLCWEHVFFPPSGGVLLYIPQSRTDPGEGAWVRLSAAQAIVDPAAALLRLRALVDGAEAAGPVFRAWVQGSAALAKTTVAIRLRKALEALGVANWRAYAAHSLRRGGATHAAAVGVPVRFIMLMGRWSSDMVRQYMYFTPGQVLAASSRMLR